MQYIYSILNENILENILNNTFYKHDNIYTFYRIGPSLQDFVFSQNKAHFGMI